jgi:hypothetical protein
MSPPLLGRRSFLGIAAASTAGLVHPGLLADPYRPVRWPRRLGPPVRVQGRVTAVGRGLARVAVSDGLSVVETGADGTYELLTTVDRDFVMASVPAGHAIPRSATGTARFYHPMRTGTDGTMEASFEFAPLPDGDDSHAVLLLADVQTQDVQEMGWFHERTVPDVRDTVAALEGRPVLGIACGDIMYDDLSLFPEYERAVQRMGVPFFQVVGNHDLDFDAPTDQGSSETFSRHFGPRYYSFDRGAVHYVVLDDVFWHGAGYIGYLDADQLTWLAADLARVEHGRPVVVAQHIPSLGSEHVRRGEARPRLGTSVANREALYRLLEPYRAHILVGHTHEHEHVFTHGVHELVSATVCGAWWSGPICGDGAPSGYTVLEVSGETLQWRYKATGHPAEHQLRLYPRGADPAAPTDLVANVWDWDPEWTVVWYEGGERRGPMARRLGLDPLSVELHTGPELPPRRTWVEPYPTNHLFYAPVPAGARDITVEATDRFGRRYVGRMPAAQGTR